MKYLQDEYYDKVNMRIFMKIAIEIKIIMLPYKGQHYAISLNFNGAEN